MADKERDMDVNWIKIGEHENREALVQTAKKIRSKWSGRYDFQISECPLKNAFALHLRHR